MRICPQSPDEIGEGMGVHHRSFRHLFPQSEGKVHEEELSLLSALVNRREELHPFPQRF